MKHLAIGLVIGSLLAVSLPPEAYSQDPFVVVLGIGQDAGVPQAGSFEHPAWEDPSRSHYATSIALVDPETSSYWIFDVTPDFRQQWYLIHRETRAYEAELRGAFITHAHIGHYAGLMFLGHESAGARDVPVFAMPRMADYLTNNGPWSQLVKYNNISLNVLGSNTGVTLNERIKVTPFLVPHRQEFAEVVGYKIEGPNRSVIFLPDIDSWTDLDEAGGSIEDLIAEVDVAYLDATFYANGEIPGRDMSGFPHPFITVSMERFKDLPASEKGKIRFIHLNHTNPALVPDSEERREILSQGFRVAARMEIVGL